MNLVSSDGSQVARIEEVVLDGVAGPREVRVLEPADGAHELVLHVERQAGRDAVRIDLVRLEPLGLDEDLVRRLVREAHDLVLDGRAVARTHAFDDAGEHRRAIGGRPDDLVRTLVRLRNETIDLLRMLIGSPEERKHRNRRIARLPDHHGEVDACGRRCAAACRSSAGPRGTAARAAVRPAGSTADRPRGRPGSCRGPT